VLDERRRLREAFDRWAPRAQHAVSLGAVWSLLGRAVDLLEVLLVGLHSAQVQIDRAGGYETAPHGPPASVHEELARDRLALGASVAWLDEFGELRRLDPSRVVIHLAQEDPRRVADPLNAPDTRADGDGWGGGVYVPPDTDTDTDNPGEDP